MADVKEQTENKAADKEEDADEEKGVSTSGGAFQFNKVIELYPNKESNKIQHKFARCFEGKDNSSGAPLIAVLCDRVFVPRISKVPQYSSIVNPNMLSLKAAKVIKWPKDNKEYFTLVYKDNLGKAFSEHDNQCALSMKSDLVQKRILHPLIEVLKDLRNSDISHGNIRPSNIFRADDPKEIRDVVLGDCLSAPTGVLQPKLYEPIERALAQPSGRGEALPQDDLYSLGVTMAMFLRSTNPLKQLSEDEVIVRKLEVGSFAALIGQERLTGPMLDFLRGVLQDDPSARWSMEQVLTWMDGQRVTGKGGGEKQKKATRQIVFNAKKFFTPQALSIEVGQKVNLVDDFAGSSELNQWLDRALSDKKVTMAVEKAIESIKKSSSSRSANYQSRLATRLSTALYPEAPLRFKNLSIMPDGFGFALGEHLALNQDPTFFREILLNDEMAFWLSHADSGRFDIPELQSSFEECKDNLKKPGRGYGLELFLYRLNSDAPCLSPMLQEFYITTPENLVRALDRLARRKIRPDSMFDTHIISFLMAKEKNLIENNIIDLNAPASWRRLLATLRVVAKIQKQSGLEELPDLNRWFVDSMRPVIDRYHDREYRTKLNEKIQKERDNGDLSKLYEIADNPGSLQKDLSRFKMAMKDYTELEKLKIEIEKRLDNPKDIGIKRGLEVAVIVCFILAVILIMGFSAMTVGNYQDLGF